MHDKSKVKKGMGIYGGINQQGMGHIGLKLKMSGRQVCFETNMALGFLFGLGCAVVRFRIPG